MSLRKFNYEKARKYISYLKNTITKGLLKNPTLKKDLKRNYHVFFKNGGKGKIVEYDSGNLGINIEPYETLCEPLENYSYNLKHKKLQDLDIIRYEKY